MHELYLAECIVKSVVDALPAHVVPAAVTRVLVQVGQLDAVVPESLRFSFDAIKAAAHLTRAELVIEEIRVLCHCRTCGDEFGLDLPLFLCPACGSSDLDLLRGRGITLTRIVADDPEGKTDGHTDRP